MTPPPFFGHRPKFHSTKAVLALSGVLTVALVLLAAIAILLARGDMTREADKDALNIAQAAGQDIARNLELYDLQLRTIARQWQNPGLQALTPALRWSILFDGVARDKNLGFINILNEHGDIVADSGAEMPRSGNFVGRDYLQGQIHNTKDALFVGEPFDKAHGTLTMLPLSRRMVHQGGSFAGVVMGSARLDYFARLFSRFPIGMHGTITLLLDNGMILQRRPAAPTEIGHIPTLDLLKTASSATPATALDPVDRQLRRFVLYHPEGLPLVVAVGLAPVDIYAAWNARAMAILFALGFLGLSNALLLYGLRRAAARQNSDAVVLRRQALELEQRAKEHAALVAEQKQAHECRQRQLDEIAHDMRTPVHCLLSHADLMRQKGTLNSEQAHHLTLLRSAGEHLRAMADRFLHDARKLEGSGLLLEPVDIRALIGQCGDIFEQKAKEKGLHLVLVASDELPQRVLTDKRRIIAILSNLLENAIQCTDCGSVALHVSLEPTGLRWEISDTGPGMAERQKRRLLQEDGDGNSSKEQTGRGLTIVRRHLTAFGGQVSYSPRLGGGSIIRLDVPVIPAVFSEPAGTFAPAERLRMLVVDDSADSREATAGQLAATGHAVIAVHSGEAAVQRICDADFDAVVLDARMPGLSGPDTAKRIRAIPGVRSQVPIIILSATSPDQGLSAWQQTGISAYLQKSGDISALLQAIRQVVRPRAGGTSPPHPSATQYKADRRQLGRLREGVLRLRNMLDSPTPAVDQQHLREPVHRIAGDAAQFGLTGLAAACWQFEQAVDSSSLTKSVSDCLILAANDALTLLRQRLHALSKGEERSARPMT